MNYFSFLICFHPGHADIFLSGFPVGVVREGVFHPHQIVSPAGNPRALTMRDLQGLVTGPCPFQSMDELKEHLQKTISLMAASSGVPKS